jgi:hypothetical protein
MPFCARMGHFIQLLLKHRHIHPSRLVKIMIMLSMCLLLQRSIKKEDALYEQAIKDMAIEEDPVFITGHWRSGTTHLHYLLSLDTEHFAYPTNYQCFFPTVFLTLDEMSWTYRLIKKLMGKRTRLIDNMEFALTSPQEEEWMYLPEGGYSYLFETLVFPWTAVSDPQAILQLSNDQQTRDITLRIFKKLTYASHKRILSKSPGHFSRVPLLKEIFPSSKFIFLVRNPYEVVISTMNTKKILTNILSMQKKSMMDITATAKFLEFYFSVMHQHIALLKENQYIILKYEDLIELPIKYIQHIYRVFNLHYSDQHHKRLIAYLEAHKDYKRNEFHVTPQMKDIIYTECKGIFEKYGYTR